MPAIHRNVLVLAVAATMVAAACSAGTSGRTSDSITVFAASSLTEAFTEIGDAFESARPGTAITFNFAASSELASQILEGAPADVFASADRSNLDKVVAAGLNSSDSAVFATNTMSIIVAPGNPKGIRSLADLADPDLVVVLCAAEVPCGKYAAQILSTAGVSITPRSFEQKAKAAVAKVVAGEADAAIVFTTDVTAAGTAATGVEIPAATNTVAEYPIVALRSSGDSAAAAAFVAFVQSDAARTILTSHGFGAP